MHSKVVIASLVCMLAASFGAGNKAASDFKKTNRETKEMVCRAPNDNGTEFFIINDMISNGDEARAVFTSEKRIYNARVVKTTPGVNVRLVKQTYSANVFIIADATKTKQAVMVAFGVGSSKASLKTITKTIYIYNDGQTNCYSALSEADVLAKYFMNYVATPEQRAALANGSPSFEGTSSGITGPELPDIPDPNPDPHPDPWPPIPDPDPWPPVPPNPPRFQRGFEPGDWTGGPLIPFDPFTPGPEESYVNFIFGDKQDMEVTVSTVSNSGINQRVGTGLNAQVNWYDENNVVHPAKGVSVQFYANGAVLHDMGHIFSQEPMSYDYRTGVTGYCNVDVRSDCRLNLIEARVCADSSSTRVEDNFMIDYPFFARASSDPFTFALSDYAEVNFTINIYSKKSERGEAFAMSQMQNVPYDYAAQFSDDVDAVKTIYPSEHTYYDGENNVIMVQPEDKKSWDVLNHEYGHHIADELELCSISNDRVMHNVFEDLTVENGDAEGKQLAYSEGLATYLGIASQMYYSNRYNFAGYGDEVYQDSFRDVTVDYNQFGLGQNNYDNADGVEARVTSVLLKLMDDNARPNDNVALGHENMFNCIEAAHSSSANIHNLIAKIAETYPQLANDVYDITDAESIPDLSEDEWTIMIYASGGDFGQDELMNEIYEMLSATGQPANVNVIIEAGGARYWPAPGQHIDLHDSPNPLDIQLSATCLNRLYIKNGQLRFDEPAPLANMGASSTFEDFLNWGLNEYPAQKVGVILWDVDGRGLQGVCYDEVNYRHDPLLASEMHTALENVFEDNNIEDKLEFVGYDASRMQVLDIAEFNSDFFNYMVASQSIKSDDGWEYDFLLEEVYAGSDTETILETIVDSYFFGDDIDNQASMSVLDLNMMEEYLDCFDYLVDIISEDNNHPYGVEEECLQNLPDSLVNIYDSYGVFLNLACSVFFQIRLADVSNYMDALDGLVIYNDAETSSYHGLSLFVPINGDAYPASETRLTNWYNLF
jgi:hypothetical protein